MGHVLGAGASGIVVTTAQGVMLLGPDLTFHEMPGTAGLLEDAWDWNRVSWVEHADGGWLRLVRQDSGRDIGDQDAYQLVIDAVEETIRASAIVVTDHGSYFEAARCGP